MYYYKFVTVNIWLQMFDMMYSRVTKSHILSKVNYVQFLITVYQKCILLKQRLLALPKPICCFFSFYVFFREGWCSVKECIVRWETTYGCVREMNIRDRSDVYINYVIIRINHNFSLCYFIEVKSTWLQDTSEVLMAFLLWITLWIYLLCVEFSLSPRSCWRQGCFGLMEHFPDIKKIEWLTVINEFWSWERLIAKDVNRWRITQRVTKTIVIHGKSYIILFLTITITS